MSGPRLVPLAWPLESVDGYVVRARRATILRAGDGLQRDDHDDKLGRLLVEHDLA